MGTKNNPGKWDCYANADPDEPMFILLGRDKHAPALVRMWADLRAQDGEDHAKVQEARDCAQAMQEWHEKKPLRELDDTIQKEIDNGSRCPKCKNRREAMVEKCGTDCIVGRCYFGRNCQGCRVCQ